MQSKIIVVREENQDWLSSEEQGEIQFCNLTNDGVLKIIYWRNNV